HASCPLERDPFGFGLPGNPRRRFLFFKPRPVVCRYPQDGLIEGDGDHAFISGSHASLFLGTGAGKDIRDPNPWVGSYAFRGLLDVAAGAAGPSRPAAGSVLRRIDEPIHLM